MTATKHSDFLEPGKLYTLCRPVTLYRDLSGFESSHIDAGSIGFYLETRTGADAGSIGLYLETRTGAPTVSKYQYHYFLFPESIGWIVTIKGASPYSGLFERFMGIPDMVGK